MFCMPSSLPPVQTSLTAVPIRELTKASSAALVICSTTRDASGRRGRAVWHAKHRKPPKAARCNTSRRSQLSATSRTEVKSRRERIGDAPRRGSRHGRWRRRAHCTTSRWACGPAGRCAPGTAGSLRKRAQRRMVRSAARHRAHAKLRIEHFENWSKQDSSPL